MSRKFLVAIDLAKNELQNAAVHNLAGAPASPVKGQLYMNTTDNTLYWWNGTAWVSAAGGGAGFPGYGSVPAETTFGLAQADGVATTVARSDHTHGSPVHNAAAHSTIPLNSFAAPTGPIGMAGFTIGSVGAPVGQADAANKGYVDGLINGLSWKGAVRAATTANITLSNTQTIDGVAVIGADRVLVKNQTNQTENGIYTCAVGAWTRAVDLDAATEFPSATTFVREGTANADTSWTCTNDSVIIGTTNVTWVQAGGPGAVTAGAGMTQSGNTLNVVAADASISVTADAIAVSSTFFNGTYMRRAIANCSAATTTTVSHGFGSRGVAVSVYRSSSPWDEVDCDVEHLDANNVIVRFAVAPASAEYQIAVIG
jgi:hypothetical protein